MNTNPMNMMFNQQPQMNVEMFKRFLPKISAQELEQIKQMAKSMGMSDAQIEQGMSILNQMK